MTNPYCVPTSNIPPEIQPVETQSHRYLRWFVAVASIFTILVLLIFAVVLIPQAMRLDSKQFRSAVPASWIGGITAVCGVVANVVGLFLIRARKVVLPLTILAISIACMIAIAILFKPS